MHAQTDGMLQALEMPSTSVQITVCVPSTFCWHRAHRTYNANEFEERFWRCMMPARQADRVRQTERQTDGRTDTSLPAGP